MQYFGNGAGGGGGGGVFEIQELRRDSPKWRSDSITVKICSTPRIRYSNLGNTSLMRI